MAAAATGHQRRRRPPFLAPPPLWPPSPPQTRASTTGGGRCNFLCPVIRGGGPHYNVVHPVGGDRGGRRPIFTLSAAAAERAGIRGALGRRHGSGGRPTCMQKGLVVALVAGARLLNDDSRVGRRVGNGKTNLPSGKHTAHCPSRHTLRKSKTLLLSSQFWPIPSTSRRVINCATLCLSHPFSRMKGIRQ